MPPAKAAEIAFALVDQQAVRRGTVARAALVEEAAGVDPGHRAEAPAQLLHGKAPAAETGGHAAHDHARRILHRQKDPGIAAAVDRREQHAVVPAFGNLPGVFPGRVGRKIRGARNALGVFPGRGARSARWVFPGCVGRKNGERKTGKKPRLCPLRGAVDDQQRSAEQPQRQQKDRFGQQQKRLDGARRFGAGRFFFGFGKVVLHKASFCDRIKIFYQKKGSL